MTFFWSLVTSENERGTTFYFGIDFFEMLLRSRLVLVKVPKPR